MNFSRATSCAGACRIAKDEDIRSVARIHLVAFRGFFLSELGYEFLCAMYRAFLRSPCGLFVVFETEPDRVVGFAVGALQRRNDRWLAIRFLPHFLVAIVPAIMRNPVQTVKRLIARFIDGGVAPQVPKGAAVLRSIAVLPSFRGFGAATCLIKDFELLALSKGARQVFLTTDELNNTSVQRFYERCGYNLFCRFHQDSKRAMWLMSKDIKL